MTEFEKLIPFSYLQEALNSTEKLYDVMFTEMLAAFECYLPIAQKLGIPVIGTVTLRSGLFADQTIGVPNNPAVIPFEFSNAKPDMNLVERIKNLWNYFVVNYYYLTDIRWKIQKFYQEYFDEDLLYKKDFSLVFYNNHASLLPHSVTPNAIDIGGIHLKPANPLPEVSFIFVFQ